MGRKYLEQSMNVSKIDQEIVNWQEKLTEKEAVVSVLITEVKDLQIALDLFLSEYNAKVGIYYVQLDKLKLKILECNYRIEVLDRFGKEIKDRQSLDKQTEAVFAKEKAHIEDLEKEAFHSAEEYEANLRKKDNVDKGAAEELKILYRKLVRRNKSCCHL